VYRKLHADVLVVSCDTITDYPLLRLINEHRLYLPAVTVLVSAIKSQQLSALPGRKAKNKAERDIIGIDRENTNRLVMMSAEADFEEAVPVKVSTVERFVDHVYRL